MSDQRRPPRIIGTGLTPVARNENPGRGFGSFDQDDNSPSTSNPEPYTFAFRSRDGTYRSNSRRGAQPSSPKSEGFFKWALKGIFGFAVKHAIPLVIGATASVIIVDQTIIELRRKRDKSNAIRRESAAPPVRGPVVTVPLKQGQTLSDLIYAYTGEYNSEVLDQVLRMNPQIESADVIRAGTPVKVPDNRRGFYEPDVISFEEETVTGPVDAEALSARTRRMAEEGGIRLAQDKW